MMYALTPSFRNCCAKISTYCTEKKEGLLNTAKIGGLFASTMAAVASPWPFLAKATVGTSLAFLTMRQIIHFHLPPDKKWLRLAIAVPLSAGMGAIYGQYPSGYTLPLPVIGIMWSLSISYNRGICGAPEGNVYVSVPEGPKAARELT